MRSPTPCADWPAADSASRAPWICPAICRYPWRLRRGPNRSDGTLLRAAAPDELEGEFDDRIDPRFPVFSAASVAKTLPGPLTPMTLDVQLTGLRAATRAMSRVMASGEVMADEWGSRAIAVFGHRPYVGVSASVIAAEQLPGWDADEVVRASLGDSPVDALLPLGRPPSTGGLLGSAAKAVVVKRALALLRHLKADTQAYVAAATAEHLGADATDFAVGRRVAGAGTAVAGQDSPGLEPDRAVADRHAASRQRRWSAPACMSPSPGWARCWKAMPSGPRPPRLAALIRNDPQLCALALDGDLDGISAPVAHYRRRIRQSAVTRIGHRGPGEVELANLMFADDPAMLLAAAGRAATDTAAADDAGRIRGEAGRTDGGQRPRIPESSPTTQRCGSPMSYE